MNGFTPLRSPVLWGKDEYKSISLFRKGGIGFTLLEKLIVGGVIGALLVMMSVVLWIDARKTRDVTRLADMAVVASWLEVGFQEALEYPATLKNQPLALGIGVGAQLCLDNRTTLQWLDRDTSCSDRMMLPTVPRDPSFLGNSSAAPCLTQGAKCDYTYVASDNGKDYQIRFALEGPVGSIRCAQYPCVKTVSREGIR